MLHITDNSIYHTSYVKQQIIKQVYYTMLNRTEQNLSLRFRRRQADVIKMKLRNRCECALD